MKHVARPALVLGTVVVGTAGLSYALLALPDRLCGTDPSGYGCQDSWSGNGFLLGPPLVGGFVALAAAGRSQWLALGAAAFVTLGVTALVAMGSNGLAEGGGIVVTWIVGAEIVGLYAMAGVWWLVRRLRDRPERS